MSVTSAAAKRQAILANASDPFIWLVTIDHSSLGSPIRICNNNVDIVSNGNTFIGFPFSIQPPTDSEQASSASLTISNVSRKITRAIENMDTSPVLTLSLVLASTPNTIEVNFAGFTFTDVSWDANSIRATISQAVYWQEPYPRKRVTPRKFPGLFAT